jgi:urease accessory protein
LQLVHHALAATGSSHERIAIPADRLLLAKRRWRGVAHDGTEFGFDLEKPLNDGDAVFENESAIYVIAQKYEPVLEVSSSAFRAGNAADAARLGWMIGNLHFQIEIAGDLVRVVDDPAVRQLFEREGIAYTACKRVFHPISGGHHH